ncbi:unnamed protein product [Alopecurus aequalis]
MEPPPSPATTASATMAPPRMLVDDLVGEILFRLPPGDPACLARASLVCKPWRRLLSDPDFRRRYREFHGTPPLLGYLHVLKGDEPYYSRFVSTSALRPADRDFPGWLVLDCRHGRALFAASGPDAEGAIDLVVWNPVTNEQRRLPNPWTSPARASHKFNAAVLCAAEGCDHMGCHGGPFRVVFLVTSTSYSETVTSVRVYSSESGAWSETNSVHHPQGPGHPCVSIDMMPSVLLGDALYFSCGRKYILQYQPSAPQLSVIATPPCSHGTCIVIMKGEDGLLNFVDVEESTIYLWSRQVDANGIPRWAQTRTIKLETLLPDNALPTPLKSPWIYVSGFVEGTDVIFVHSSGEVYMVQLKSRRVTKMVAKWGRLYPFTGFGIPAIKAGSVCEGPSASSA